MSDYIFIRKSRNTLSAFLHFILNFLLGAGSITVTVATNSWLFGIILVVLSKWRIFAVQPRYWLFNLKSNLVDLIVGSSFIFITFCSSATFMPIHLVLAICYTAWLIIIKPKSSPIATEIQALIAVFLGATSSVLILSGFNPIFLILACFIIGYGASRHIVAQSDDSNFAIITLTCGLVFSEIAWLYSSWSIVYMFGNGNIIIPQLAIILTTISFTFNRIYKSISKHDHKLNFEEIAPPIIFSLLIIVMLVLWFSNPAFNV